MQLNHVHFQQARTRLTGSGTVYVYLLPKRYTGLTIYRVRNCGYVFFAFEALHRPKTLAKLTPRISLPSHYQPAADCFDQEYSNRPALSLHQLYQLFRLHITTHASEAGNIRVRQIHPSSPLGGTCAVRLTGLTKVLTKFSRRKFFGKGSNGAAKNQQSTLSFGAPKPKAKDAGANENVTGKESAATGKMGETEDEDIEMKDVNGMADDDAKVDAKAEEEAEKPRERRNMSNDVMGGLRG